MRLLFTKKTPTKEGAETASNPPSSPPQLYSLELDFIDDKLSWSTIVVVVDALS